jgi:hypothetical protein
MQKFSVILTVSALVSLANAAEWSDAYHPLLRATYSIYSGQPGERMAPTTLDRKLTIIIDGGAAKEIFDSIGPDARQTCSAEQGYRERNKKGVICNFSPQEPGKGYRCWIGLNLRTGDSMPPVGC